MTPVGIDFLQPTEIYEYRGSRYPGYLKTGNAMRFIEPTAKQFCKGQGLDVGAGDWPLHGSMPIDLKRGSDALNLPEGEWNYIFSSHCLEHLGNTVEVLEHWKTRIKPGGVLFLYLPHPDMHYWRPQNCRKHLHLFYPKDMAMLLTDLGFINVIHSERDLAWSFAAAGFKSE